MTTIGIFCLVGVVMVVLGTIIFFSADQQKKFGIMTGMCTFFVGAGSLIFAAFIHMKSAKDARLDRESRTTYHTGKVSKTVQKFGSADSCTQLFAVEGSSCNFEADCGAFPDFSSPQLHLGEVVEIKYILPNQFDGSIMCELLDFQNLTRKMARAYVAPLSTPEEPFVP